MTTSIKNFYVTNNRANLIKEYGLDLKPGDNYLTKSELIKLLYKLNNLYDSIANCDELGFDYNGLFDEYELYELLSDAGELLDSFNKK